jgi:hypothetical protein
MHALHIYKHYDALHPGIVRTIAACPHHTTHHHDNTPHRHRHRFHPKPSTAFNPKPGTALNPAVLEGMDVVYKVEAVGSGGGATSKKVVIADSGELKEAS